MSNLPEDYNHVIDDKQIDWTEPEEEEDSITSEEEKKTLLQYIALKEEAEMLEEDMKTLGVKVKGILDSHKMQRASLPGYGTFSVILVPRWKYSSEVTDKEEFIKRLKKSEVEAGVATSQATSSLRFTKDKS